MRPRCHRKWRPVFCEKLEYFQFLWKENTTGHSCSHHSSRGSSGWKVMVPKLTPYDVDLGPVCFLSRLSSCLRDKRPKQYPTVEHSEVVQKCKTRRRCCCSPGKCLMSWRRATEQQMHRQGTSGERSAARYAAVSLLISCSCSCVQCSSSVPLINQKAFQWRYHANRINRLFIISVVCFIYQDFSLISISRPRGER